MKPPGLGPIEGEYHGNIAVAGQQSILLQVTGVEGTEGAAFESHTDEGLLSSISRQAS